MAPEGARATALGRAAPRRGYAEGMKAKNKGALKTPGGEGFPFRHVVLLMLENRSFDQMLGLLQKELGVDGVPGTPPRSNTYDGRKYAQRSGAVRKVDPDPPHEYRDVRRALAGGNAGFVASFARKHPDASGAQRQQVMCCYRPGELGALHALARSFVVCDAWHCSVPGPTWTNRLFAMSGTSLGKVDMPEGFFEPNLHRYQQPSVFRRLAEAGLSYRIYFGDVPLALLLEDQRKGPAAQHFSRLKQFQRDAKGPEADFPRFAFIEPDYLWPGANDDHPPHDVQRGQALVADVYEAIRANEALWHSTLLVISYDEHGGFYDHVVPKAGGTIAPDDSKGEHHFGFDRTGLRVPTLLVSPRLTRQVLKEGYDHTSLLRMLQQAWGLGDLGRRTATARNPLDALTLLPEPRRDTPKALPRPRPSRVKLLAATEPAAGSPLNDHQRAILAFSDYLETLAPPPPRMGLQLAKQKFMSPAARSIVASECVLRFLRSKGADL